MPRAGPPDAVREAGCGLEAGIGSQDGLRKNALQLGCGVGVPTVAGRESHDDFRSGRIVPRRDRSQFFGHIHVPGGIADPTATTRLQWLARAAWMAGIPPPLVPSATTSL